MNFFILYQKRFQKSRIIVALFLMFNFTAVWAGGTYPFRQPPRPPLSCNYPPDIAAISFFEFFETPGTEKLIFSESSILFSRRIIESNSLRSVIDLIREVQYTYSLNNSEIPLSSRLLDRPRLIDTSQRGFNKSVDASSIMVLALSSRGKIEQRISMVCESGSWKVDSLSYGPPEKY